jgi:hypothetical protein
LQATTKEVRAFLKEYGLTPASKDTVHPNLAPKDNVFDDI